MRFAEQMKKASSYAVAFGVGVAACAVGLKTYGVPAALQSPTDSQSKQAVLTALDTTPKNIKPNVADTVVADAAAKVDGAVVTVHTVGKPIPGSGGASPFGDDPIFRRFFGGGAPTAPVTPRGAGSGVIISSDGYIITNNHVVANTSKLTVNVGGNAKGYDARVIGTDPVTDIAVVKIDTKGVKLPVAQLGNSDDVRIGEWAIAVGNPLDVGTTVTLGIISALNRSGQSAEGQSILPAIQTDAAINPGNSGGALANINGQVIGINEAILSPSGTSSGIGFAIPINRAKQVAAELIRSGKVSHPYLGVSYRPVSSLAPDDRAQVGIPASQDQGVVVERVYPGSPAAVAGLHLFDVITTANGQPIVDQDTLNNIIQTQGVGSTLTLKVLRDGSVRTLTVALKERPLTFGQPSPGDQPPPQGQPQSPFDQP